MPERKLKLLCLIAHCGQGGDWVIVQTTVKSLPCDSVQVWLNGSEWTDGKAPPTDGPIKINQGWRGYIRARKAGLSLPKDLDVIHAHSPAAILMALLIKRWHTPDAKIVFTFHWPTKDGFLRKKAKKWLFQRTDLIHCYSIGILEILSRDYSISKDKISLLYLGVDASKFRRLPDQTGTEKREALSWDESNLIIGYLGRFDREKNVSWLLRFMENKRDLFPRVRLLLFGGGALEDELKLQAKELVKSNIVHFAGYTRSPEQAYPLMDLHVLPSSFEAFALTVVEAALCGVPTLRTNVEGAIDQIEDGVDGFLCDISGGFDTFEKKLMEILNSHQHELPEIGIRSREKLAELCDVKHFGSGMLELYQNLTDC